MVTNERLEAVAHAVSVVGATLTAIISVATLVILLSSCAPTPATAPQCTTAATETQTVPMLIQPYAAPGAGELYLHVPNDLPMLVITTDAGTTVNNYAPVPLQQFGNGNSATVVMP